MKEVLVTGSMAFDFILRIDGRFGGRLPDAAAAGFSAAFVAPSMRRRFGGCAGNIAYGLRQLGGAPTIMAAVGEDFAPYRQYLAAEGIADSHILEIPGALTAQAFMVSDDDDSQLIFFHPGAAGEAHRQSITELPAAPQIAIVSPNGREGMLRFGRELAAAKTPFIFDPGQAIGLFSGEELAEMLALCQIAIFNQDEYAYCRTKTDAAPSGKNAALLITHGADGSEVQADGKTYKTKAAQFGETADTTGCGDAYRAGLMHGILRGWQWQQIIQFAAVVAGAKATAQGGQGYTITAAEAEAKCKEIFGKE